MAALVAGACGCLNYDERIIFSKDGSGVLKIHLMISKKALAAAGAEDKDRMSPKSIAEDFRGGGMGKPDIRIADGPEYRSVFVVVNFDSAKALGGTRAFKDRDIRFASLGEGKYSFTQRLSTLAGTPEPGAEGEHKVSELYALLEKQLGRGGPEAALSGYTLTFSARLPGRIDPASLGRGGRLWRGKEAVWVFPLLKFVKERDEVTMTAASKVRPG
jgi:hypothetical protein